MSEARKRRAFCVAILLRHEAKLIRREIDPPRSHKRWVSLRSTHPTALSDGAYCGKFAAFKSAIKDLSISSRVWSHPLTNASGVRLLNDTDFEYLLAMRTWVAPGAGLVKKNSISKTALAVLAFLKSP